MLCLHPTPACRTSDSTQIWAHVDWLTSTNYRADGAQDIRMCANWNQERTEQILHCLTALDSWELSSSYQLSLLKTYPQDSQNLLSTTATPASVLIQIAKAGLVSISLTYQKNPATKLLNPMWSWVSYPEQQKADRTQPGCRHHLSPSSMQLRDAEEVVSDAHSTYTLYWCWVASYKYLFFRREERWLVRLSTKLRNPPAVVLTFGYRFLLIRRSSILDRNWMD